MPSAVDIVSAARAVGGKTPPAPTNSGPIDEELMALMRQVEAQLGQLQVFLVPTLRLPPKLAAIPLVGRYFGEWIVRLYNRLFQRQQVTNRQLVDVLGLQWRIIERLLRNNRDGR